MVLLGRNALGILDILRVRDQARHLHTTLLQLMRHAVKAGFLRVQINHLLFRADVVCAIPPRFDASMLVLTLEARQL